MKKENPENIRAIYHLNFLKRFTKYLNSMEAIKLTRAPVKAIITVTTRSSGGICGKILNKVPPRMLIFSLKLKCIVNPFQ